MDTGVELGEQPGSCWHFCVLEFTQESGGQQCFHEIRHHPVAPAARLTRTYGVFFIDFNPRMWQPQRALGSHSMPNIWTNLGNHVCSSPLWVKGQLTERPPEQKGSIPLQLRKRLQILWNLKNTRFPEFDMS